MSRLASGLRAWVIQRLTAVYLAGFIVYAWFQWAFRTSDTHAAWQAWLARPAHWVAVALFILALLFHAWVGMRDVLLDYVHALWLRLALLALVLLVLASSGLLALRALLEVGGWA